MSFQDDKWFEIWYVQGVEYIPAYLVVVTPDPKQPNKIIVLDLQKNEVLFQAYNYDEVREWLLEDEFGPVNGRVFSDDGWG